MKLSTQSIVNLCRAKGMSLTEALRRAQISRTAYYSLVRKDSLLPRSISALAFVLGVSESELLESEDSQVIRRARQLQNQSERLMRRYPRADRENILHTLLLLDEPPIQRLNRSLLRGRRSSRLSRRS